METTLSRITKYSFRKKHRQSFLLTKLLPILVVGAAAYVVSSLSPAPLIIKSTQRVFSEGLKIELDHSSPAFAAMEDSLLGSQLTDFDSTAMVSTATVNLVDRALTGVANAAAEDLTPVNMLMAGERSAVAMVDSIRRENRREELLASQERQARKVQEDLMIQAAANAFEEMAAKFAQSPARVLQTANTKGEIARTSANSLPTSPIVQAMADQDPNQNANLESAARLATYNSADERAGAVRPVQVEAEPAEVTKTIHLAELGMTREQFMREFFMPLATSDTSDVPPNTMVAGAAPSHSRAGSDLSADTRGGSTSDARVGGLGGFRFVRVPKGGRSSRGPSRVPTSSRVGAAADDGLMAQSLPLSNAKHPSTQGSSGDDGMTAPALEPAVVAGDKTTATPSDAALTGQQLTIAGEFQFADGLALTSPADSVVIYRESDGQVFEQAAVWIKKASYEIFMEKPEGDLVAELRNPQGDLLGRTRVELAKLNRQNAKNPFRLSGINFKIIPVPQGLSGQILALVTSGPQPIGDAQVSFDSLPFTVVSAKNGRFGEPSLMEGSSVTIEVHHPGYLPTRAKAFAGASNHATLLPAKSIRAIQAVQAEPRDHSTATIMGVVTRAHSPVSGAQVMFSTSGEVRRVVYFNAKNEPDPSLEATGPNGMYAIYGVGATDQKVRATWGSNQSETIVVTAHDRFAEQADLELTETRTAKLRVFDAFRTNWPLAAQVQSVESEDPSVQAPRDLTGSLKFKTTQRGLMLDIDAGQNYELSRMIVDRDRKSIYMPMIQTSWLEQVRGSQKVSSETHAGHAVGFIQGNAPFEIQMDESGLGRNTKLYYFNRVGEITNQQFGEPGGGFIIFNLPEGSRSIMVQAKGMSKSYTATVQVESRVTNVINHWMR